MSWRSVSVQSRHQRHHRQIQQPWTESARHIQNADGQERVLWWASILSSKRAQWRGSDPTCKIASKHRPTSPSPRGIRNAGVPESGSMPYVQACTWCLLRTRVERFEETGGLPRRLLCTSRVSTKHATGSTHTHTRSWSFIHHAVQQARL